MLQQPSNSQTNSQERTKKRSPVKVSAKLDKSLLAYALAAGAAGVSVLAMTEPAQAHIVATPVNIPITENAGIIQFDINGDGIPDFGLSANIYEFARTPPMGNFSSLLRVVPAQAGNEEWAVSSNLANENECAAAVHKGMRIGGTRQFRSGPLIMLVAGGSETRGRSSHCPWNGTHSPYLGLKFMIDGQVHYGWARVNAAVRSAVLTGFAYETVPNKPIIAGATDGDDNSLQAAAAALAAPATQPASLGMLAIGSSGMVAWRRPDEESPTA
jgi:hypothetical protein